MRTLRIQVLRAGARWACRLKIVIKSNSLKVRIFSTVFALSLSGSVISCGSSPRACMCATPCASRALTPFLSKCRPMLFEHWPLGCRNVLWKRTEGGAHRMLLSADMGVSRSPDQKPLLLISILQRPIRKRTTAGGAGAGQTRRPPVKKRVAGLTRNVGGDAAQAGPSIDCVWPSPRSITIMSPVTSSRNA